MSISISTHVLNLADGQPAAGMQITLQEADGTTLASAATDDDGRIGSWPGVSALPTGNYRLVFGASDWFAARGEDCFFPSVAIDFAASTERHYHVPLLVNRYGYSTYRGS